MTNELLTEEGVIAAINEKGLSFDKKHWYNYSTFRDEEFVPHNVGDRVRLFLNTGGKAPGKFITDLMLMEQGVAPPPSNGHTAPEPPTAPTTATQPDLYVSKWALESALRFYEIKPSESFSDDDVINTALKFAGLFSDD
jgi:hypothetical protein